MAPQLARFVQRDGASQAHNLEKLLAG